MSQFDFGTIDPLTKTGTQLADDLNRWRDALNTSHWGSVRPPYIRAGMLWVDDSASPDCKLYLFDGTADLHVFSFNTTSHIGSVGELVPRTSTTGAAIMPSGTTAERDATPLFGYTRANSDDTAMEWWNGTAWVPMGGGATGAPNNPFIYENDIHVTADYTVTAGKNGLSGGPITIDNGVTVTVPSGSTWSVV